MKEYCKTHPDVKLPGENPKKKPRPSIPII